MYCALFQVPSPAEREKRTETCKDAEINPAYGRVLPCLTLSPNRLRLEFPDELDEGTVTVLVGVLGPEIVDLVSCFHKVDGDLTLLH